MTTFGENCDVSDEEIEHIRSLENFDLIMLISEIHEHGWDIARGTLSVVPRGLWFSTRATHHEVEA